MEARHIDAKTGVLVLPPVTDEQYEEIVAALKGASEPGSLSVLPLGTSFVPTGIHLERGDWLRIMDWYDVAWEEGTAREPEHEALYAAIRDHVDNISTGVYEQSTEPENRR
ncbi:hypothetical protein [Alicyclobacillus sp. ALC3]|uniref:hypothetical protein n=1 Tax=Alicyclobacillus sp. ALC3 TaxID=2796143 RepID=UPI002378BC9F|nr:hypothetical protein [Alicyclobacillus sp. ALC3]WDL96934.1 hypothetical protein JC200_22090 [Alicyclobacillus sp. ALC3]